VTDETPPFADVESLTAVLRHFDWTPTAGAQGVYQVWTKDDQADAELILPLDPQRGDYEPMLQRVQAYVFRQYGRAARELWNLLSAQHTADLRSTRWKKDTPLAAGMIAWDQGEQLYLSARAQLAAAAKSTRSRKRYHGNANSFVAKQVLEGSFMGQTDIGSFIITAYIPAKRQFFATKHAAEESASRNDILWSPDSVSGTQVLTTFEAAVTAIRTGLDEYRHSPRIEVFQEAVEDGVSFEMVRALSEFTVAGESSIEIDRDSVVGEPAQTFEVAFNPSESTVLVSAANALAVNAEPLSVTLTGEVTLLSRSSSSFDQLIRLDVAKNDNGVHIARVRLNPEQYDLAMEAHRRRVSLRVSGRLEREGNLYWLYSASNVAIVPPTTDAITGTAELINP